MTFRCLKYAKPTKSNWDFPDEGLSKVTLRQVLSFLSMSENTLQPALAQPPVVCKVLKVLKTLKVLDMLKVLKVLEIC